MGKIYLTDFYGSVPVGKCSEGSIYAPTWMGNNELLGTYEETETDKGIIYRGQGLYREAIGSFESGKIYRGITSLHRDLIGTYDNEGRVYEDIGLSASMIGKYEGTSAGAAALLLFKPEFEKQTLHGSSSDTPEKPGSSTGSSSSPMSTSTSFVGGDHTMQIFGVIVLVVIGILGLIKGIGYIFNGGVLDTHNKPSVQETSKDKIHVGSILTLGTYEQNYKKDGLEDLEWIVLVKEDDRILVVSRYIIDGQPFNIVDETTTWETCSLRTWLNNTFYNTAFNSSEKSKIQTVTLNTDVNNGRTCNPTNDRVFLLSIEEAKKYFPDDSQRDCLPTDYAKAQGVESKQAFYYASNYWLRTPGFYTNTGTLVFGDGEIYIGNGSVAHVANGKVGVRPAMWIIV